MHLEEEPLLGTYLKLGTHSKGTLPSNSTAGEERGFAGKQEKAA